MKVFGNERYNVYIHELDHPPPHCHVRFGDQSVVCVTIPLVEPLYGEYLSRAVRDDIENNLDALTKAWDRLHPKKRKTPKGRTKIKKSTKRKKK